MTKTRIAGKTAIQNKKTDIPKELKAGKSRTHEWTFRIEMWLSTIDHILIRMALSLILIYEVLSYIFTRLH
jgi:hypothetical protein